MKKKRRKTREKKRKKEKNARMCDNMGRVFLSRCGARVNSQDHGQSQVHMSKQLNREGQTTIHKLKTR